LHEDKLSLRDLYGLIEMPGKNEIRDLHHALDAAVTNAYGFNPKEDLMHQLLELNLRVAQMEAEGKEGKKPGPD
jgi:hypothetical protein